MKATILMPCIIFLFAFVIGGCIGDSRSGDNKPVNKQEAPIINLPAPQTVDTKGLATKEDIIASSNSTQNQLTGLINTSFSKVAEKVALLENNMRDLLHLSAKFDTNMTATTELKAKLEANMTATADIKTQIQNIANVTTKIENDMKVLVDMKNEMANAASAQIGFGNRFDQRMEKLEETITASAGRDVNMLPKTAVDLLQYNLWAMVSIITALCGLASTTIALAYRAARKRESERTALEREERKNTTNLLFKVLALVPEQHRESVNREIEGLKPI